MNRLTESELKEIMQACVGVDESVGLDGDIMDIPFPELGYDSLAVLEVTTKVQDKFGVPVPDEMIDQLSTPRALIDYVNTAASGVAS